MGAPANANRALEPERGDLRPLPLPDDVVAPVQVVAQAAESGDLRPLPLPGDVVAPVQVVAQAAESGDLRPLPLPDDVVAPVEAVPPASSVQLGPGAVRMPADDVSAVRELAVPAPPAGTLPVDPPAPTEPIVEPAAELWAKAADYDDEPSPPAPTRTAAGDNEPIYRIVRAVATAHSGEHLYGATEHDPRLGLLYGLVLFPQVSPHFGSALRLMQARDDDAFRSVFGPASDELLAVTGAAEGSARLAEVAGEALGSDSWRARFRAAGEVPAFRAAQNEEAIEHQFRPMLATAFDLGLTTERALALAYDAVVAGGLGGGLSWLTRVIGRDSSPSAATAVAALVDAASGAARTRLGLLRDADFLTDATFTAT
jgi:hypothetical protein